jgi:cytochrome c-type biogenesis protein CcmH
LVRLKPFKAKLLGLGLLWICLGLASDVIPPQVRQVGMRLACLCKSCRNTVGDCQMLQCHYSAPAREKIASGLKAGQTEDQIVASFVSQEGRQALAVPPSEGFHLLAWWTPLAMSLAGIAAIWIWIRRRQKPEPAPEIDSASLERFRAQAAKDMAEIDE